MELLAELGAKEEIRQAALRYCRGVDRLDFDLMFSAYHPDAHDDHGVFVGPARDLCERVVASHARYDSTMHCVLNHAIELTDDTTAVGEIYNVTYLLHTDDLGTQTLNTWWGRYLDRYELRDGRWAISHRTCVHEFTKAETLTQTMNIDAAVFKSGAVDRGVGAPLGPAAYV